MWKRLWLVQEPSSTETCENSGDVLYFTVGLRATSYSIARSIYKVFQVTFLSVDRNVTVRLKKIIEKMCPIVKAKCIHMKPFVSCLWTDRVWTHFMTKEKKHCLTAQSSVFSTVNTWLQKGSINSRLTRPKFKTPGLKHLYTDLIKSVPLKPDGAFDDKVNGTVPTLGLRRWSDRAQTHRSWQFWVLKQRYLFYVLKQWI